MAETELRFTCPQCSGTILEEVMRNVYQYSSICSIVRTDDYTVCDYDCNEIVDWRAEGPDFSCFMINPDTIKVVGFFDENFKGAYCEDWDYHRRIAAARIHTEQHDDQGIDASRIHAKRLSTAPYMHYSSQTLIKNRKLRHEVSMQHGRNRSYYLRKWGAEHDKAMDGMGNIQPFGDARMSWRDW